MAVRTSGTGKRAARWQAIRDVVRSEQVRTQIELVDLLAARHFDCTQATISRDIGEMGLRKSGEGIYVLPEDARLHRMVSQQVVQARAAASIVVVSTTDGGAPGVAGAIDEGGIPEAMGTVAGDNTIFIATASAADAAKVVVRIDELRRRSDPNDR